MTQVILLMATVFSVSSAFAIPASWVIKRDSWTANDERNYSDFVAKLGTSGCNTVDRCFKSPANPYRASDAGAFFNADCAKFPYMLRAYFAWKNNLPFSYASNAVSSDGRGGDVRYSPNGNSITSRRDLVTSTGRGVAGMSSLRMMQNEVLSAMFRVHPLRDNPTGRNFQDFYSVGINRDAIRPGTMIYDPAGHVVVVYKVETDGRVRYFDAHPDKTVSRGVFGEKFARSRPGSGAGFKNFRPLYLVGSTVGSMGERIGGRIVSKPMRELPGFSLEQFFGTQAVNPKDSDWSRAQFVYKGVKMRYFDFVRARLAVGDLKYHPVVEMQNAMEALCGDLQDRVLAVQGAITAGIHNQSHPERLPNNIYGTGGDWEEYSSPSRDARLKTSFKELRDRVQQMVEMYQARDPKIDYTGTDLAADLRAAYDTGAKACVTSYTRTDGSVVTMDFDQAAARVFAMSFDPYHCIELRWGATEAAELGTCRDSNAKLEWYRAEQRLRNQIDRTYDARMNFSVQELLRAVPNSGADKAPDIDTRAYLASLPKLESAPTPVAVPAPAPAPVATPAPAPVTAPAPAPVRTVPRVVPIGPVRPAPFFPTVKAPVRPGPSPAAPDTEPARASLTVR